MIYFYEECGKLIAKDSWADVPDHLKMSAKTSRDFETFNDAHEVSDRLNAVANQRYTIPIDRGEWVAPRYDVIELPKVGDKVSYGFNGDCYPCGTIVRITPSLQIVTSDGKRFTFKNGGWKYTKTWSLVKGHINKQNPHF